jgi:hypothetical protein
MERQETSDNVKIPYVIQNITVWEREMDRPVKKINKPNCIVQCRYRKGVDRAYRYLSCYSVVTRKSEVMKESGVFSTKLCIFNLFLIHETLNSGRKTQEISSCDC